MGLPGSSRNVQQLVDAHYVPLYRYAYRLTGSASDAEDLTQETFCKAQLNLTQLRDTARAKAWLFSILRNAYLHRLCRPATPVRLPRHGRRGGRTVGRPNA